MGVFVPVELSHGIPEGWTPLEVVAAVKCLDEDGDVAVCLRKSSGLNHWEALGMLELGGDAIRADLRNATHPPGEDNA